MLIKIITTLQNIVGVLKNEYSMSIFINENINARSFRSEFIKWVFKYFLINASLKRIKINQIERGKKKKVFQVWKKADINFGDKHSSEMEKKLKIYFSLSSPYIQTSDIKQKYKIFLFLFCFVINEDKFPYFVVWSTFQVFPILQVLIVSLNSSCYVCTLHLLPAIHTIRCPTVIFLKRYFLKYVNLKDEHENKQRWKTIFIALEKLYFLHILKE